MSEDQEGGENTSSNADHSKLINDLYPAVSSLQYNEEKYISSQRKEDSSMAKLYAENANKDKTEIKNILSELEAAGADKSSYESIISGIDLSNIKTSSGSGSSDSPSSSGSSKSDKVKKGLGKALKVGAIVGGGAFALTKFLGSKAKGLAKGAANSVKSSGESSGTTSNIGFFLLLTLLLHAADAFIFNFGRNPSSIIPIILLYLGLTFVAVTFIYKSGLSSTTWTIIFVSLAALAVPPLVTYFAKGNTTLISLLIFFPVWPWYLVYTSEPDSKIHKWGTGILKLFILLLCIQLLTSDAFASDVSPNINVEGSDTMSGLYVAKDFVWGNAKQVADSINSGFKNFKNKINDTIAYDPYGSTTENNEGEQPGIYLTNVRILSETLYANKKIDVLADISAKSFEGAVQTYHSCYIEKDKLKIFGMVSPAKSTIIYEGSDELRCRFGNGTIKPGYHNMFFEISFFFTQTSTVAYVYTDNVVIGKKGKDIYNFLDLKTRVAEASSSDGPIAIRLSKKNLPIGLDMPTDLDDENNFIHLFTVQLENVWPQGKLNYIRSLTVTVPSDTELINCTYDPIYHDPIENTYSFGVAFLGAGGLLDYKIDAVSCDLVAKNGLNSFLSGSTMDKRTVTVAVNVDYAYTLKKGTQMRVR